MLINLITKVEIPWLAVHPLRIAIPEEISKGVNCVRKFEEFQGPGQPIIPPYLSILKHSVVL